MTKKGDEWNKKHKPNRIAQLIAQKRTRLAKMAHGKCSSSIKRSVVLSVSSVFFLSNVFNIFVIKNASIVYYFIAYKIL